jgi:hypothetical protein
MPINGLAPIISASSFEGGELTISRLPRVRKGPRIDFEYLDGALLTAS